MCRRKYLRKFSYNYLCASSVFKRQTRLPQRRCHTTSLCCQMCKMYCRTVRGNASQSVAQARAAGNKTIATTCSQSTARPKFSRTARACTRNSVAKPCSSELRRVAHHELHRRHLQGQACLHTSQTGWRATARGLCDESQKRKRERKRERERD